LRNRSPLTLTISLRERGPTFRGILSASLVVVLVLQRDMHCSTVARVGKSDSVALLTQSVYIFGGQDKAPAHPTIRPTLYKGGHIFLCPPDQLRTFAELY
jgi:hypothetical protein